MRSPFCNVAMLTVQVKIDCCHGSQWQPHAKILAKIRPIPLPPICQGRGGGRRPYFFICDGLRKNRVRVKIMTSKVVRSDYRIMELLVFSVVKQVLVYKDK